MVWLEMFPGDLLLWTDHIWDRYIHANGCGWMYSVMSLRQMLREGGCQPLCSSGGMKQCAPVMHTGDTQRYFQPDWTEMGGECNNARVCFLYLLQGATQWCFFPSPIRKFTWHIHDPAGEGKIDSATCSKTESEMKPAVDIQVRTSFISPRNGTHFCQITVIVSNGTVVAAQQSSGRERQRGEGFTLL